MKEKTYEMILIDVLRKEVSETSNSEIPGLFYQHSNGKTSSDVLLFTSNEAQDEFANKFGKYIEGWIKVEKNISFKKGLVVAGVGTLVAGVIGVTVFHKHLKEKRLKSNIINKESDI